MLIEISLNTKLVGYISTAQSWEKLTNRWNETADSLVGQVAGLNPVENNLVVYPTNEALDGLFLKIENIFR